MVPARSEPLQRASYDLTTSFLAKAVLSGHAVEAAFGYQLFEKGLGSRGTIKRVATS